MLYSSKTPDIMKSYQLNANMYLINMYADVKRKLEEKLRKLLQFNAMSPAIFAEIASLQASVNQGLAQTKTSWNASTGTFTVPSDLSWSNMVTEKWNTREKALKAKEKAFHENNIKELKKYTIYALPYEDPETKEVKVIWFIDKNGVRIFDEKLQNYVEKYGKELEGMYEVVSWEKIYELDIESRKRGNGKNYLNENQLPKEWQKFGEYGANLDSAVWFAKKSGLMDLALIAGLAYQGRKATNISKNGGTAHLIDNVEIPKGTKIIQSVEKGTISLTEKGNTVRKSNYGELKMDQVMAEKGYNRISSTTIVDIDAPIQKGIDGIYYNPNGHPPYIIGEAKFDTSTLSKLKNGTKQMSDDWIKSDFRLEKAVGEELKNEIILEGYDRVLVEKIKPDGSYVTTHLDKFGNKIQK